jgi:hypothetical protein
MGVSDTIIARLWGIDLMFVTAEHGGSGVNLHGGDQAPRDEATTVDSPAVPEGEHGDKGISVIEHAVSEHEVSFAGTTLRSDGDPSRPGLTRDRRQTFVPRCQDVSSCAARKYMAHMYYQVSQPLPRRRASFSTTPTSSSSAS